MFLKQHMQMGELYLEYFRKCQQTSGIMCDFCTEFPPSVEALGPVARPKPHSDVLPELCYLPYDQTPKSTSDGARREVDDFQLRVQLKKHVEQEVLTLDDEESIAINSTKPMQFGKTLLENILSIFITWTWRRPNVLMRKEWKKRLNHACPTTIRTG